MNRPRISVIITTYNAQDTIAHAIKSVLDTTRYFEIEIIVVDDCSKDDTCNIVRALQKDFANINLFVMPQNSGGPSAPRNLGIEKASGEYITFLDDDDWIDANRLMDMVDYAITNDIDFLKGYLIVTNREKTSIYNRLAGIPQNTYDTIKSIVSFQSTNSDFLVKRTVLLESRVKYATDLRIGEDTVFTVDILTYCQNVRSVDNYFLYHVNGSLDISNVSSTQQCGDREINHQITAWQRAQKSLFKISLDYYKLRLHVGLRNMLISIVRYSKDIGKETYIRLHEFVCETRWIVSGKMNLHSRYKELYDSIISGDYEEFLLKSKKRLLICGYDLKFILPVIPYLKDKFEIKVDEWTGHDSHDKKQSEKMAEWADIIWCEWLLGNAVFYSNIKNDNQRLIIRAHRFELSRDFGHKIKYNKVDMVITVGYYYFEQFAKKFMIPRNKMRLLPNYVEETIYSTKKSNDAVYNIGMVGILPARKGFHRGLAILKALKERDSRFKLYVMGHTPDEVSWIKNNPTEASYYDECNKYIIENNLSESVVYGGFLPRNQLYENIGYVLSLSDAENPESFHLAPAEGACAGSVGLLLNWPGVEYIYPKEFIFPTIEEITEFIYRCSRDPEMFKQKNLELKEFVLKNYNISRFIENLNLLLKQLYLLG